jgi:hypothetical protein
VRYGRCNSEHPQPERGVIWAHGTDSRTAGSSGKRRTASVDMLLTISGPRAEAAMLAAIGLLVSRSLLAESHLFGETRAGGRIVRRYHGIIAAKTPLLAILLWCEVVMGAQVSLE